MVVLVSLLAVFSLDFGFFLKTSAKRKFSFGINRCYFPMWTGINFIFSKDGCPVPSSSIQARIHEHKQKKSPPRQTIPLMEFIGNERADAPEGIPFGKEEYLNLVEWTGRAIRDNKSGYIPSELAPILERLNLD